MVANKLGPPLHEFGGRSIFSAAAEYMFGPGMETQYKFRPDECMHVFGGYNLMMFGDTLRFPFIPSLAA